MPKKLPLLLILACFIFFGFSLPGCLSKKQAGVWRSDDSGETWQAKVQIDAKKTISGASVLKFVFDPADSQKIYLGTDGQGMYLSRNNGDTWEKTEIASGSVWDIAVDADDPKIIYVAVFASKLGRIYKTEDSGDNWEIIFSDAIANLPIYNILIDWYNHENLIITTGWGGVLKSGDQGKTWTKLYELQAPAGRLQMDEENSQIMWYVTPGQGIFKTEDSGATWQEIALSGLKDFKGGLNIYELERDKQNHTFYLATSYGLLTSNDGGVTWAPIQTLAPFASLPILAAAVNPKDSDELLFVAGDTVYKSVNQSDSWQVRRVYTGQAIRAIKYHPNDPQKIYLGVRAAKK
ncbi:hypothetical protein COT68_02200 [bacterium (Candidatus Torokbacteria) CG09_land_8_20_14_0_10_42_11]|nr:MAG: hypothetical protein COT68_02200 [bacterium (Candidatus Torokbacteria) CG09_land_8_20_14_0_10_42_11]